MLKKHFQCRLTTFGFEINIMDKCCVCGSRGSGADCKRILCESTMSPCCFCTAYVTHTDARAFHWLDKSASHLHRLYY